MNKIKTYLDIASEAYFNGNPIISDEVFDRLAELHGYSAVGARQHGHIKQHYRRMYSLQKYYAGETNVKPLENEKGKVSTPKLDGAAISTLYISGTLVQVLTRGDGIEGTDITDKFLTSNIIPKTIITDQPVLQITGEVVAPKNIENARNYAAGSLNLKDITEFNTRSISFFAYGIYPYPTLTFSDDMRFLEAIGFDTVYAEGLLEAYDCDGIVCRVNSNARFEELGYTAKVPKGAYAIKERSEAVETKLLGVEWNVGRTGKVVPTAILEPVKIGDSLVSRATLNNPGFIEALGLCIGDTVAIHKAGEIIPCILYKVDE